jgi:hypothetical protein
MKTFLFIALLFSLKAKAQVNAVDKAGNIVVALQPSLAGVTGVLPFANGGITGNALTSAATGTISVAMTNKIITVTPSGALTLNATGGTSGQDVFIVVNTSGITSFVVTLGTNFRANGTLATGTVTAKRFILQFIFDGTVWNEVSRTTAL